MLRTLLALLIVLTTSTSHAQNSVAREWNEVIIEAIRNDFARPTVHARNLYHHSIIAYDLWAAYDPSKETFFLGDTLHGYICNFNDIPLPADIHAARDEAISYASFRFIENRYSGSPDFYFTYQLATDLMNQLGYDINNTSLDYLNGGPAELGNYIADQIQQYGYTDNSNEVNDYGNTFYDQLNPPIVMSQPGNPDIQDPNHWQPIALTVTIDQSGNPISSTPPHLSPEWGYVHPFSLDPSMANDLTRDGDTYRVYFDTVIPAYLNPSDSSSWDSFYKWNHALVSIWQSHLDPNDGVIWDISPASIGNNTWYPTDSTQYAAFYDLVNGGDPGTGYMSNPVTGSPYIPQMVPRADYARVLAEFWADGIDSETPPGHWYEIYHYVTDQPTFERKWQGVGPELDPLEYDVKAHLALGGTLHDAAICAWSLKGYYDYIRPVSAIRHMADLGQSSDTSLMSYHPSGIPLMPGFIELVLPGDSLAGQWNEHVGKIKLYTWKGHTYINDPVNDVAGVGWILAEHWWPYQRPTFVTPPFAGFVSGHSTFSRAAANTMEFMTGSPYFPGGMGEFQAVQDEYLKFEDGPSQTITLQWASYKDAADQCSLSRLWGGIHPPIDDIPGRLIGEEVGVVAFDKADSIFQIEHPALISAHTTDSLITVVDFASQVELDFGFNVHMDTMIIPTLTFNTAGLGSVVSINNVDWIDSVNLKITLDVLTSSVEIDETELELNNLNTFAGSSLGAYTFQNLFIVDTKKPMLSSITPSTTVLSDLHLGTEFYLDIVFDEPCDTAVAPSIAFSAPALVNPTLTPTANSMWTSDSSYHATFGLTDFDELVTAIETEIAFVNDAVGNAFDTIQSIDLFSVDTENPTITAITSTDTMVNQADLLSPQFFVHVTFNEFMDTTNTPTAYFLNQGVTMGNLLQTQAIWQDTNELDIEFIVFSDSYDLDQMDFAITNNFDRNGNLQIDSISTELIWSDMKSPEVLSVLPNKAYIADSVVGADLYYIDITFTESMNTTGAMPLVMLFADQSITGSVQYNVPMSSFTSPTEFRAYYQVIDQGIEEPSVHLSIEFGQDFSGNDQIAYIDSNFTWLDTKNPSVLSLTANEYVLDQAGQTFDVLAVYDEQMNASAYPQLEWNPIIQQPLDLILYDSAWLNPSTYMFYHTLSGSSTQMQLFEANVHSATDLAGNVATPISIPDFLQINSVLGLSYDNMTELRVYPTLLQSGGQLIIDGEIDLLNKDEIIFINSLGQQSSPLKFSASNGRLVSEPIQASPGLYYLNCGLSTFKIIIH